MTGLTGRVLITGGTGTLGHAILAAARREGWDCTFTSYARSELRQALLKARYPDVRTIIGDVRDADRLAAAAAGHDVIIHAAALKRIPECEASPGECYATNVGGSLNVARAAWLAGVPTVIGISTDKACKAVTVYGASKLAMEGIWRAQAEGGPTFVCVRYGNVVASNGSVIPLWRQQHRAAKPLTITDMRMTRFWMAPSSAVALIAQAAHEAPGTVLVPKIKSMSVVAMARAILPGARLDEIGLRSAEKLHEDLVHSDEPVSESLTHFRIGRGTSGTAYTSFTAPNLSDADFRAMLAEAEELER